MKQVLIVQGGAVVEEIPAPIVEPGTVLVRVEYSCISVGTEMSSVKTSSLPLWKRALKQPENMKKVVDMALSQGFSRTYSFVQGHLSSGAATGYSAAGVVIEVGEGVTDIAVGDRVACAGAQCAHHAEYIRVPRNLAVLIPDEVGAKDASTVTLGAIAMQGVRRASPTLGETFVVIGLGVLGQITAQLLRANGCRVIAADLDEARIKVALSNGANVGLHPADGSGPDQVARLTNGIGADGVIVTAASPSNDIMSQAFKMTRKKGRVVLVGDVGLELNRADFYQKEIDFFISSSYGPGRYDRTYEEKGLDYPVPFVRWTENRNMQEYLQLIGEKRVVLENLISGTYPIEKASDAYQALKGEGARPLMLLLSYPAQAAPISRKVLNPAARPSRSGRIRVALAGAGGFAKGMHLPNLDSLSSLYELRAVVSRTGHNANGVARQFGAAYASTVFEEVLRDSEIDAVIIATRHNLHADMVLKALQAGKHVLVEKPLALSRDEVGKIEKFYASQGNSAPILLTGFNRRFSKYATRIRELAANRSSGMIMRYRMNAGYIPLDHWVHSEEGGGRNIGEACHIYDLFTYLANSRVMAVSAHSVVPATAHYSSGDNFVATAVFEDGSIGTLTYTAQGAKDYPKEHLEVYVDGKVLELDDYKKLKVHGSKAAGCESTLSEKGQREELEAFAKAIQQGGEWPIPLWQQLQATEISFQVEDQIRRK